jgi:TetR/AcrR family fatty acid metabolism transcriptional regulator
MGPREARHNPACLALTKHAAVPQTSQIQPNSLQCRDRNFPWHEVGLKRTALKIETLPSAPAASEKYQRILDAAVEVIAENGYFNSPISAIAARAGVADGTVYLYFKSKDDVLRTAIDASFNRFHQQVQQRFETLHDPREQLLYIAEVHLGTSTANRSMAILMQTEVRQSAKFIAEFSHHHLVRYIHIVREIIRRGQAEGVFRKDISDGIVAHCMFGAIDELLSSAIFTGRVYDANSTAAQVLDVLLNGFTTGKPDAS